jgi:hypothetical protein
MTYRDRRLRRAERLREWADKRQRRSDASFTAARRALDGIEPGQPILVGHHSEKRHRKALDRHDSRMRDGCQSAELARSMDSRADEIDRQAEASIYSDDPDAIDRLREKLSALEAQRERIKVVNKAIRRFGVELLQAENRHQISPALTEDEARDLIRCATYGVDDIRRGYPAYVLSNLAGNITRARQRLASLSGTPAPAAARLDGATATARAGLTVTAGMTSPSRPGKSPRPVWTVTGALAEWRQALLKMGGSWYRGAVSFWDDPTADIEQMCVDAEAPIDTAKV